MEEDNLEQVFKLEIDKLELKGDDILVLYLPEDLIHNDAEFITEMAFMVQSLVHPTKVLVLPYNIELDTHSASELHAIIDEMTEEEESDDIKFDIYN